MSDANLDLQGTRTRRICGWLVIGLVLLGTGARVEQYLARPSYWNDEAAVVINLMTRDYAGLARPLDYAQAAPPGFLWSERFVLVHLGRSEYVLRLLPLLIGLASVPLFAVVAWRALPHSSAFWAVGFLALCDRLIPHVSDVKQYGTDLLVGIVLLAAFLLARSPLKRLAWLSATAVIGIWWSFPCAFLFGGMSLALLPACWRAGVKGITVYVVANLLVVASFAGLYFAVVRHGHDPSLLDFWAASFPDWRRLPLWLAIQLYGVFRYSFDTLGAVVVILTVTGVVALCKMGRRALLASLGLTFALAFVAASLHRYPFPAANRLCSYLIPIVFLMLGAGAEGQNFGLRGALLRWWWILPAPLLLLNFGQTCKQIVHPRASSTTRQVAAYLMTHRKPDEPMYLVGDCLTEGIASGRNIELLCYWPAPPGKVVVGIAYPQNVPERRFWLVYSLDPPNPKSDPFVPKLRAIFEPRFRVIEAYQHSGQSGALCLERVDQ
jgi:hypothetical protein